MIASFFKEESRCIDICVKCEGRCHLVPFARCNLAVVPVFIFFLCTPSASDCHSILYVGWEREETIHSTT